MPVARARPAVAGDLPVLRALHAAALVQLPARRGGPELAAVLPSAAALEQAVTGQRTGLQVLSGTLDDELVGIATVVRPVADGVGSGPGRLELLFVDPPARRRGVGRALLDAALGWAAHEGCTGLDAPALPGDRDVKSLFEALGMRARLLVHHRALPTDLTPPVPQGD